MNRDFVIGGLNIKELFRHLNGVQNSTRGKVWIQENFSFYQNSLRK
jgi:hypothetical protein